MPPSPPLHEVLSALAKAVADFDAAAAGAPGEKVKALGPAQGPLPDLIRNVLGAVQTALKALRPAMTEGEKFLTQAAAALALLHLTESALVGLIDAVGEAAQGLGTDLNVGALKDAGAALKPLKDFLQKADVLDGLLPLPEDVRLVRQGLDRVLGPEPGAAGPAGVAGPGGGSLDPILKALAANP